MISFLLSLAIALGLFVTLQGVARRFVRDRLRYVGAVQRAFVPWATGGAAALVAMPVMAVLPIVGLGTAITVGLAVGAGVANGARDIRRGTATTVFGA